MNHTVGLVLVLVGSTLAAGTSFMRDSRPVVLACLIASGGLLVRLDGGLAALAIGIASLGLFLLRSVLRSEARRMHQVRKYDD